MARKGSIRAGLRWRYRDARRVKAATLSFSWPGGTSRFDKAVKRAMAKAQLGSE
jgi:hypothetical protein